MNKNAAKIIANVETVLCAPTIILASIPFLIYIMNQHEDSDELKSQFVTEETKLFVDKLLKVRILIYAVQIIIYYLIFIK